MLIKSTDGKRVVDIGRPDIWKSLYSTIVIRIDQDKQKYPFAISFFENGYCSSENGYKTARQFNLIRDALACVPPDRAVYDLDNRNIEVPWKGRISPVITSCANLYTTADGKDLLFELVSIFCYAEIIKVSVGIQ